MSIGKAVWGVNKKFGRPLPMLVSSTLQASIGTDCDQSGFTFSTITGFTWKGFFTPAAIGDRQLVDQTSLIQIGLKARLTATHHDTVQVIGLTGAWFDDGDGIPNAPDSFLCTGNATTSLFIK